jgi:hypothetical protein
LFVVASGGEDDEADGETSTGQSDLDQLAAFEVDAGSNLEGAVNNVARAAQTSLDPNSEAILTTRDDGSQAIVIDTCICLRAEGCDGPPPSALPEVILDGFQLTATGLRGISDEVPSAGMNIHVCGGTDVLYRVFAPVEAINTYLGNRSPQGLEAFRDTWTVIEG